MKHLEGAAHATAGVPIDDCFALLAAVEEYPSWYPDVVRNVNMVESGDDGLPLEVEVTLHLSHGPVSRDLDLLLAVSAQSPGLVQLTHIPRGSSGTAFNATWRLKDDGADTELDLELDATMPVPRLVPLGGVGDAFAVGFMQAAVGRLESIAC